MPTIAAAIFTGTIISRAIVPRAIVPRAVQWAIIAWPVKRPTLNPDLTIFAHIGFKDVIALPGFVGETQQQIPIWRKADGFKIGLVD